jgi:hypothetical protein
MGRAEVREGTLTAMTVDVAEQVLVLHVHLRLGGFEAEHVLRLEGVTELRVHTPVPCPWTFAALSELRSSFETATRTWLFEMVLWAPEARLRARCATVRLDGMAVDPEIDAGRLPAL